MHASFFYLDLGGFYICSLYLSQGAVYVYSRESLNALGALPHVEDLDGEVGDGEDEFGLLAELDLDHVIGVSVQGQYLIPRLQVPDLSSPVCNAQRKRGG